MRPPCLQSSTERRRAGRTRITSGLCFLAAVCFAIVVILTDPRAFLSTAAGGAIGATAHSAKVSVVTGGLAASCAPGGSCQSFRAVATQPHVARQVQGTAQEGFSDVHRVLLLHPDTGTPAYVEAAMSNGLPGTSWPTAAAQIAKRARWDLASQAEVEVMGMTELCSKADAGALSGFSMVLGIDLLDAPPDTCQRMLRLALSDIVHRVFVTSAPDRRTDAFWQSLTKLSGASLEDLEDAGPFGLKASFGGWTKATKLRDSVIELFHRSTAEEAVYATLLLIDGAVQPLDCMAEQRPVPTFETLSRAINRCQTEFRNCFTSPKCLQSLACLSQCGLADQSCSYRCIVSYQTEAFTQFSLCALQKQNLLNSQVRRPTTPLAAPLERFRGTPLTKELAENILVGHYDPTQGRRHGWLVAAGSNPAYEQFLLQHQLWYKGEARNTFWYHPTFLVEALDGRKIWRTRDYRVRYAGTPGIWEFSVLDNGIISEERWHLLGADDDLKWMVLFYIGAAKKAGIFYRGCLILTRDGDLPTDPAVLQDVGEAVGRAGMHMWELEVCHNPPIDPLNPPPLIAPETQPPAPLLQQAWAAA
eukprot:TRINITY_DN45244_c0_g1_i1.p1 TRINITY_DN45244_c0_g1~~TRINITY_DN45244_c0_g1_i1.p1  ORF type:complete len:606 (-),score=78.53 TRINITY_DN45244_c0_g1_i1:177-1940(-)